MGIWDAFSDIVEAVTPWSVVEAEAPAEDKEEKNEDESKDDDDEDEDEEEEEEDDEPHDPKEQLEEECKNSAQCHPAKHHFDECVERVQQQESEGGAKEDCVEEFFHLAHCATACAAPKLWAKLK
ncbi:Cytochrome b-c1 complex subunit 6, mitochondrial [Neonectria punicea]|uniref:Cytochrome b-c1 complex subunit 6, mitochondrial n=1 Tax=Neonectria punicea TaxID=979145 RepID=A0ABR1GK56_9HYPO